MVASYTDGQGTAESVSSLATAAVLNVNDAPTATNLNASETYTEGTALDLTDIVVTDVDSANVTVILTLSDPAAGSLSTGTSGAVTSTYNAGTGLWTASGAIANVNTLLAGVTFTPALNYNSNFTIAVSVDDGTAPPVTGVKSVTEDPAGGTPPSPPVGDNPTEPEDIPNPAPDTPEEDPYPPEVEEVVPEEDTLNEDASDELVSTGPQTSAGINSSRRGLVANMLRAFGDRLARDLKLDGDADIDQKDIQGSLSKAQTAWNEPTPRVLANDPNYQRTALKILRVRAIEFLQDSLDDLKEDAEVQNEFNKAVVSASIALSTGLSVGYVVWLLRSGVLLSSLLSSMPAWRFLDPLPILVGKRDDSDEEDEESLETIVEGRSQAWDDKDKEDSPSSRAVNEKD